MRNFILFFLSWVSFSAISQDFIKSRVQPMLSAHKELITVYPIPNFHSWDCPPKLTHNQLSSFDFLDSLPVNINYDEQFFASFLAPNCANYYALSLTYQQFLPDYLAALKKQGLDEKYAILPLTVSANNPSLKYLDDKSGAWQLSFVNGRKYGLTINRWYDERNDITKSSKAAAAYLKFLKGYYLNNELLVITAFYTSVPFVNKQLNSLESPSSINFIDALPTEVQGYLWYLKAWSNWNENFDNSKIMKLTHTNQNWEAIQTSDTLSFEIISDFMGVSILELKMINPVLVGETVLPNNDQPFYLPKEKALIFNQKHDEFILFQKAEEERKKKELAELKKQMESGIPNLEKYKAVTYTVQSGDVLGKIADKNNVKVSQIKQWNNLRSDRIDIGQKLVLYVPKNTTTMLPPETADNKIETKPTKPNPGKGSPQIYTVKPGESLWLIAKKFPGVSAENIMEWNGCTEKISPGIELKIYEAGK